MPGNTRWDEALFDSDSFGWDIDTTPYVNPLGVELTLRRTASAKIIRNDDATLKRTASAKLIRRQE